MYGVFLKEIKCRWCGQCFYICQSCWRGQAYCSDSCRSLGYLRCKEKRQKKYRNTSKGKKTRRKAERKRSLGQSGRKSGDATSNTTSSVIPSFQNQDPCEPCCHFCGQNGLIIDHFPRRRYGNRTCIASDNFFLPPRGHYDKEKTTRGPSNPIY